MVYDPVEHVSLWTAVKETQADRIAFHSTETKQGNQVVHSFGDRKADSCFFKPFGFESIEENNPICLFTQLNLKNTNAEKTMLQRKQPRGTKCKNVVTFIWSLDGSCPQTRK